MPNQAPIGVGALCALTLLEVRPARAHEAATNAVIFFLIRKIGSSNRMITRNIVTQALAGLQR
jgi:hypothetical protein